jgi:hypothetical protein
MLEFILKPWHLLVLFLASHLSCEQRRAIEYLHVEGLVTCVGGQTETSPGETDWAGRSQVPRHPFL